MFSVTRVVTQQRPTPTKRGEKRGAYLDNIKLCTDDRKAVFDLSRHFTVRIVGKHAKIIAKKERGKIMKNTSFDYVQFQAMVESTLAKGFDVAPLSVTVKSNGWACIAHKKETSTADRFQVWTNGTDIDFYIGRALADSFTDTAKQLLVNHKSKVGLKKAPNQVVVHFKGNENDDTALADALLLLAVLRTADSNPSLKRVATPKEVLAVA